MVHQESPLVTLNHWGSSSTRNLRCVSCAGPSCRICRKLGPGHRYGPWAWQCRCWWGAPAGAGGSRCRWSAGELVDMKAGLARVKQLGAGCYPIVIDNFEHIKLVKWWFNNGTGESSTGWLAFELFLLVDLEGFAMVWHAKWRHAQLAGCWI